MTGRGWVAGGLLSILIVSGLTAALPVVSAMNVGGSSSAVTVSLPKGAGLPAGAPGYSPDSITVVIGVNNTVNWINNDTVAHTVTANNKTGSTPVFDSGNMNAGANFTYTFTTAGTYNYLCIYHSWMTGTVIVKASTSPVPEFPVASLALVLLAAVAIVVVAAGRVRRTSAGPMGGNAPPVRA